MTLAVILLTCPIAGGQELTEEQRGPWSVLKEQVSLGADRDWDAMVKFLHPKLSVWGDNLPSPVSISADAYAYFTKLENEGDEVIAHHWFRFPSRLWGTLPLSMPTITWLRRTPMERQPKPFSGFTIRGRSTMENGNFWQPTTPSSRQPRKKTNE